MCIYKIRQNDILLETDIANESKSHDIIQVNKYLEKLEKICSLYGIALIFDEVYSAFRFGPGLLTNIINLNVKPDIFVLGKTIGLGIPCGIIVGSNYYLNRQIADEGYNKSVIQGTFSNSEMLSSSISLFLKYIYDKNDTYVKLFALLDKSIRVINKRIDEYGVTLSRFGLLVTTNFKHKSPYNWLLQFYLLKNNIYTSCYGSSRMNFNLSFSDKEILFFQDNFMRSVQLMNENTWFTGKSRNLTSEIYLGKLLLNTCMQNCFVKPYEYIMLAKNIDIDVSHHNKLNFATHYFSSLLTLYCYFLCMVDEKYKAMYVFIFCQFLRQMGHFLFEDSNEEAENAKIGFNNTSKKFTITMFILLNILTIPTNKNISQRLLKNLILVMCLKISQSASQIGVKNTVLWIIKIITDMITDLDDMGPNTFIDCFTDPKVLKRELDVNFNKHYINNDGTIDIQKIIMAYFGLNSNYNSKVLDK